MRSLDESISVADIILNPLDAAAYGSAIGILRLESRLSRQASTGVARNYEITSPLLRLYGKISNSSCARPGLSNLITRADLEGHTPNTSNLIRRCIAASSLVQQVLKMHISSVWATLCLVRLIQVNHL